MRESVYSALILLGTSIAFGLAACGKDDPVEGEEGLVREELGSFVTDTGGSVAVPFEVPEGSVSTQVWCGPYGYENLAAAEYVNDTTGAGVYDMADETATAMRVGVHADLLPMVIPVSPDLDVAAGGWTLGLFLQAENYPQTVACSALHRVQEVGETATVDLRFVFVGVDDVVEGLNASTGDAALTPVLDIVKELWGAAGIEVGDVSYTDFDGDVATYESVDGDEEFGALLRTTATPGDRVITLFFVEQITDTDGATILGLSGGPPGTAAVGGTSKSGVVVSAADMEADPDQTARIIAHEGAHFVGLFHTTEKEGDGWDPLGDTPRCDVSADADQNGTLNSDECVGKGAENLMWWSSNDGARELSADQSWVMRRSAAVH